MSFNKGFSKLLLGLTFSSLAFSSNGTKVFGMEGNLSLEAAREVVSGLALCKATKDLKDKEKAQLKFWIDTANCSQQQVINKILLCKEDEDEKSEIENFFSSLDGLFQTQNYGLVDKMFSLFDGTYNSLKKNLRGLFCYASVF